MEKRWALPFPLIKQRPSLALAILNLLPSLIASLARLAREQRLNDMGLVVIASHS